MKLPNLYEKIKAVYEQHNNIIIAVDFDDTVYDWKSQGWECHLVLELVKTAQKVLGAKIILFTCRDREVLDFAVNYMKDAGIELHGVNKNPDRPETSSKPFYNMLLDDKAHLLECCQTLQKLIDWKLSNAG